MLANTERPHGFDAMVGQKEIVENIRKQSILDKFFQVYMLGGQFGSGKTTMARIIALAANCRHKDGNGNPCLECEECRQILSGHSVDVIEKVYIIDEVHMLSNGAFNALLKVLEEPPEHVIFILCTTEWKKIPATVRSRAAKYYFGQISEEEICRHLDSVARKHGIRTEESALRLIAKNSDGAMRNALSLLEQAGADVTEASVSEMLGLTDSKYLFMLLDYILNADRMKAVEAADELYRGGKEPYRMISDMLDICSDCVMMVHDAGETINGTAAYVEQVEILSDGRSPEMFCSVIDGLLQVRQEIRQMPEKTTLICGVIRMLSDSGSAVAILSGQVKALSAQVESIMDGGALCEGAQENQETTVSSGLARKEHPKESENASEDLFDMFGLFDEPANDENIKQTDSSADDVQALCDKNPLIRSVLSTACQRLEEGGQTIYVTDQPPVFRLLQQQEEEDGELPFAYRLV